MALADALDEATRRWSELRANLTADTVREIERMLAAAIHGVTWDPNRLVSTLLAAAPVDDPVWLALRESTTRRAAVVTDPVLVVAARLRLTIELSERAEIARDPVRVAVAATDRLFTAPMTDARSRGASPNVIVLERGTERVAPSFQFDQQGSVLTSVARVNATLDASDDPWGAASWWLMPHAALHAIPADEVRVGDADRVIAAADAIDALP